MPAGDVTRQHLLRAAIELFTTRGYHATTTPLIARKAGVAEGTLYRHFPGKQALLNELYRGALRWAGDQIARADSDGGPAAQRLGHLARALARCATQDPAVIRMAFLSRHGDLLDERSREAARDFRRGVEQLVARAKSEGTVRTGTADLWAGVWLGVVGHALDRLCAREWPADTPAVDHVIEAAWRAIAAQGDPGPESA